MNAHKNELTLFNLAANFLGLAYRETSEYVCVNFQEIICLYCN